jgi:DNA-directed RNA polymerase specialized sigma24 family protein
MGLRSGWPRGKHTENPQQRFEHFVTLSKTNLLRALSIQFSPDTAADALADAYAYIWAHWVEIETFKNPVGYTYRVAERCGARSEMRDRSSDEYLDRKAPAWFDTYASDDHAMGLLRSLPSRQRACVLLIHAYGWTYKQTANTLGIPLTTVTNDARRGLEKLRLLEMEHQEPLAKRKTRAISERKSV